MTESEPITREYIVAIKQDIETGNLSVAELEERRSKLKSLLKEVGAETENYLDKMNEILEESIESLCLDEPLETKMKAGGVSTIGSFVFMSFEQASQRAKLSPSDIDEIRLQLSKKGLKWPTESGEALMLERKGARESTEINSMLAKIKGRIKDIEGREKVQDQMKKNQGDTQTCATPIDELDIKGIAIKSMESAGIRTLGELTLLTKGVVQSLRNVGKADLRRLEKELVKRDLSWAKENNGLIDAADISDPKILNRSIGDIRELLNVAEKLSYHEVRTLGDLLRCSEINIEVMKKVGDYSIEAIKSAFANLGIHWPSEKETTDPFLEPSAFLTKRQ